MNRTPHEVEKTQLPPAAAMLLRRAAEKLAPKPKKERDHDKIG